MKKLILLSYLLLLGLSGFTQTDSALKKNVLSINPFEAIRPYNPAIQIAYTRNLTNKFAMKIAYDHIIKYNFLTSGIYDENERRSENTHKGYVLSMELLKKITKKDKDNHLSLGVALFYRKASSNITAKSNSIIWNSNQISTPNHDEYRNGPFGYNSCDGPFCSALKKLDRFAHHKKDYGINFLIHYPIFFGKKKRIVFDYQAGIGFFYRNSYHVGRDYRKFNQKFNTIYLASGKQVLLNIPITLNFGYRF